MDQDNMTLSSYYFVAVYEERGGGYKLLTSLKKSGLGGAFFVYFVFFVVSIFLQECLHTKMLPLRSKRRKGYLEVKMVKKSNDIAKLEPNTFFVKKYEESTKLYEERSKGDKNGKCA